MRLSDTGVSRAHAELVVDGDRVRVHDLGSTNGTSVNGRRVDGAALSDGDTRRGRRHRAGLPERGLMGSALVVAAVKYGLLALLWLFVVLAYRTVRSDLSGSRVVRSPAAAPVAAAPRVPAPGRRPKKAAAAAAPPAGWSSPRARSPAPC